MESIDGLNDCINHNDCINQYFNSIHACISCCARPKNITAVPMSACIIRIVKTTNACLMGNQAGVL